MRGILVGLIDKANKTDCALATPRGGLNPRIVRQEQLLRQEQDMQTTPKEQVRKSICGSLRFERTEHGHTQRSLAEALGMNPSTIGAWENNSGAIGLDDAWQVADVYGISLDQLAGRSAKAVA